MKNNLEPIEKPISPELKRRILWYFAFAMIFCSTFVFFAVMSRTQQKMANELKTQSIPEETEIIKKDIDK